MEIINDTPRPSWLPSRATAKKASGEDCDISLAEEYQPSPERVHNFSEELKALENAEQRAREETVGIIIGSSSLKAFDK